MALTQRLRRAVDPLTDLPGLLGLPVIDSGQVLTEIAIGLELGDFGRG